MASNKRYWKSEAELNPNDSIVETLKNNEFVEEIPVDDFLGNKDNLSSSNTSRRDFLKYVGFSTAAASLAACEGPVRKTIPFVVQPETIVPGVANYYATAIADGFDFASVLVKTREGRPIKIENNTDASILGSANARVQASVLSLYDITRLKEPSSNGENVSWSDLNGAVVSKLKSLKGGAKKVVFLTRSYASPSTARLIAQFSEMQENVEHVLYDAISEDAALNAFQEAYGVRAFADYDFSKADLIISFGADFLGDWQGGGYDSGYAKGRVPKNGKMSRHVQLESNMSLTGANADKRIPLTMSDQKVALAKLYGKLSNTNVAGGNSAVDAHVEALLENIKKVGKNKAVVVAGGNDINVQRVVLAVNELLSSEAFDADSPRFTREGDSSAVSKLIADMNAGKVGLLVMDGVNPMYTLSNSAEFAQGLEKVDLSVAFSFNRTDTTDVVDFVAASNHYLESWGDLNLKKGHYALQQPVIREIFFTKQFQSCVLEWMGSDQTYYDFVKETWTSTILMEGASWEAALQDGVYVPPMVAIEVEENAEIALEETEENTSMSKLVASVRALSNTAGNGTELVLYSKVGMGDGQQAGNPWLQEFPDPITRVSWDNYVTVSKHDAESLGLVNKNVANGGLNGSYVKLTVDGAVLENVPVIIQPGQAKNTVGLSFGYGKTVGMKSEMQTGVNAYKLYKNQLNLRTL